MAEIMKAGTPSVVSALTLAANRINGSLAGEAIAAGDACYVDGAGRAYRSIGSTVGVVESSHRYAGRQVTAFRVFDPKRAAGRAVDLFTSSTYDDLGAHLDLVLRAGFIDQDGTVVIYTHSPAQDAGVPTRVPADRAAHADDERYVFPGKSR